MFLYVNRCKIWFLVSCCTMPQMFVKFNEGYYDELGNLIRQPAKVARHYMFRPSGLAFDLVVNLPIEIDCLWVPVEDRLKTLCVLRLLHALRVIRLFRYFRCGLLLLTLKALPRQWVTLYTAIIQSLRSRMMTSVSPFFLMSLLMVSMYLNVGRPLGLTPSTTMSSTVLVIWLSSLRLTCPYQRSRFCSKCVVIG